LTKWYSLSELLLLTSVARAEDAKLYLQLGHSGPVRSVAFSPDRRFVLTGGEHTSLLWDAVRGAELRRFED
jgi:WD40 repeat protein